MRERIVDVLLFLLSQTDRPSRDDWLSAVDDLFGDLSEGEKRRMADAGIAMLAAERARSAPTLKLIQGGCAADDRNTRDRPKRLSPAAYCHAAVGETVPMLSPGSSGERARLPAKVRRTS
ncbi:hypothetical protein [Methylobacterium planeticum]|uniref:Uncharacterized protein n=1 Tax=Methylobacterium planeticum TaxID=2615211 RepID=A0A6N6MTX5_9HYPH|nr:hypothetical protein [Methylobacterium planeticum]KAB1073862.1 hypothetical protein F6X51_08975 [Methylobacterium planeticum]